MAGMVHVRAGEGGRRQGQREREGGEDAGHGRLL
jgi:hypothetical protein